MLTSRTITTGGNRLKAKIRQIKREACTATVLIEIGWKAGGSTPYVVHGLAFAHEHGSVKLNLPSRPYFRDALAREVVQDAMRVKIEQLALTGGISRQDWLQVARAGRDALRDYFMCKRVRPPLTSAVIERKGHSRMLQGKEDAAMIKHIGAWLDSEHVQ